MLDFNKSLRELEEKAAKIRRKMDVVDHWATWISDASQITDKEKIEAFDRLRTQAFNYAKSMVEEGFEPKDGKHYLYEAVLAETLGGRIWDLFRELES